MPDQMPTQAGPPPGNPLSALPAQAAAPYQPQPEDISNGHKAVDAVMDGLIKLVSMPKGDLTKKDVFDEASTMISRGAYPTPESKQQLIGQLAKLPADEEDIRQMLGQYLLAVSTFRNHMHNAFGPPDAAPEAAIQQGQQ